MAEHYGVPADEEVADIDWAVFLKDARIRSRTVERDVVTAFGVRCFCITRQSLTAAQMAERYLTHLDSITATCAEPGPFIYAVHDRRIERLNLDR